jgi:hypothetical protein
VELISAQIDISPELRNMPKPVVVLFMLYKRRGAIILTT